MEGQRPTCPQGPPPAQLLSQTGQGWHPGVPTRGSCLALLALPVTQDQVGHIPPALPSALLALGVYSSGRILPVTAWFVMMEKWGHSRGVADGMVRPCNRTLSRFKRAPFRRIILTQENARDVSERPRLQGTWPLGRNPGTGVVRQGGAVPMDHQGVAVTSDGLAFSSF